MPQNMPPAAPAQQPSGAQAAKRSAEKSLPIYLDYASTTPLDPSVKSAMLAFMKNDAFFGNPSATTHRYGWQAQGELEQARLMTAEAISADAMGLYFTSGATESINLALKGYVLGLWGGSITSARWQPSAASSETLLPHVITCAAEHKATLDALAYLAAENRITLTVLKPAPQGVVSAEQVKAAMKPNTVMISLLHVNNELGVINPIQAIADECHEAGICLHVDAVQSVGKTPISVSTWRADMVSFSGHKAYGPKGIGALYLSAPLRGQLVPLSHGGGQERGLRPGTTPVHQVVGMAKAFQLAAAQQDQELAHYRQWRASFLDGLSGLEDWVCHGQGEGVQSVPNILSLGFRGVEGETLLMALKDIAISSGSACNSVTMDPSHVLTACGIDRQLASSTLRLSFGRFSSLTQLQVAAEHICQVVTRLRQANG